MLNFACRVSVIACSVLLVAGAVAQSEMDLTQERVDAAFILQLGRTATLEERERFKLDQFESVRDAMAGLTKADDIDEVARRAWRDAFGEESSAADRGSEGSYVELVAEYRNRLEVDKELYREVIRRAYLFVIQRAPYDEEFAYWADKPTLPYLLLVGCVEDWARRNQPGLMVTAGAPAVSINCPYLSTRRLSATIADEARQAAGLGAAGAPTGRIVYPGSAAVTSVGGVHFVASGNFEY